MNEIIDSIPGVDRVDPSPPGAHVPEAERNNRVIAERIRSAFHNLPYKGIPKAVAIALAVRAAEQLNMFPAKGGVSSHLPPLALVKQRIPDYNHDCKFVTGAYVQGNTDTRPRNSHKARTIDGLYLYPKENRAGSHVIWDLATQETVGCVKVTALPVTDTVIRAVEQIAFNQGMMGLKIEDRNHVSLLPADWSAGVDYEEELLDQFDSDYTNKEQDDIEFNPRHYEAITPDELAYLAEESDDNSSDDSDEESEFPDSR